MTGRPAVTQSEGPDLLATIVGAARRIVEARRAREPLSKLEERAARVGVRRGCFRNAVARDGHINVIAECKRRSPARGLLRRQYDPESIARAYERAGAAAVSVLTEPTFFDGSLDHLAAVRAAITLPVLRKDFIVDEYQMLEARASGADAVLLIVAALDDRQLATLLARAGDFELDALVEVHERLELQRALDAGATLIGVNNRDLRTLVVNGDICRELIARIPAGVVTVAESGLRSATELQELRVAGYRGFLVGERLMTSPDPGQALAELLAAEARARR